MPVSILDIDVNDASFRRFNDLFQKYQAALAKMPGAWAASGKEVEQQAGFLQKLGAMMLAQQEALQATARDGERYSRTVDTTANSMGRLVRESHQLARNIASATLDLTKWVGIGALLGGAGGVFSLFGVARLASDAAGAQRSARGLGVTSGEQQAFSINYARAVDPNSLLQNIAGAKSDYTKKWAFGALGIQNADQLDPAQLAVQVTERARQMYLHSDKSTQFAHAHGLDTFFSMDELRRLGSMSEEEMGSMRSGYGRDAKTLATDPDVQRKWQDFSTQLDRAGTSIENTFIKGLAPLEPALETFSKDLTDAIAALMSNPHLEKWIAELGGALKTAADYLGSDAFVKKMEAFGTGLGQLADKIGGLLSWFGVTGSTAGGAGAGSGAGRGESLSNWIADPSIVNPMGTPLGTVDYGLAFKWMVPSPDESDTGGTVGADRRKLFQAGAKPGAGIDAQGRVKSDVLKALEASRGLPPGLLDKIWATESGRGENAGLSKSGALGDFQFMPGTAKQYGISDRTDFGQESRGAADYMQALIREFGGNLQEAVAGYNAGPGRVEKAIQQYGNGWLSHLPAETQNYVKSVAGGGTGVTITINNNTGANVVVSSGALPG